MLNKQFKLHNFSQISTSRGLSAGSRDLDNILDPADKPRDVESVVKIISLIKQIFFSTGLVFALLYSPYCLANFNDLQDGPPTHTIDAERIPDAVPRPLPFSSTGNPEHYDVNGKRYYVLKTNKDYTVKGTASWYGTKFQGKRTSSGEPYDMFAMTAASPVLPIPSYVRVTNLNTGKQVVVKVNDRGPFHNDRVMDLSYVAAKKLGMLGHGTTQVQIEAIDTGVTQQLTNKNTPLYLQVATFRRYNNASQLAKKLKTNFLNAVSIDTIAQTDQTLYRVLVGPLSSMTQSDQINKLLKAQGFNDGFAIRKS